MESTTLIDGHMLALEGRFDASGATQARDALHDALDHGDGALIVDLSGVECIDVTGLGVLVGTHRLAGRLDRRLVLRDVPPRVARILRFTRFDRILAIE